MGGLYLLRLDEICGSDLIGGLERCTPDWSERVELPDGRGVGQAASLELYEHGPAERLTAPGSRVGFAERDAS